MKYLKYFESTEIDDLKVGDKVVFKSNNYFSDNVKQYNFNIWKIHSILYDNDGYFYDLSCIDNELTTWQIRKEYIRLATHKDEILIFAHKYNL